MGSPSLPVLEQAKMCRFLRELPDESLRRVAVAFTPRFVRKGQNIFSKGDAPSGLYLVGTGAVKIFTITRDGREVTFDILGSGGMFGVTSALDGEQQTTSSSAVCDSNLLFMRRADFVITIRSDDLARLALLSAIADRFRTLAKLFEEQRLDPMENRLARTLLRLEGALGKGVHTVAMTQLQLGSMAGISRERASRILKQWAAAGILEVRRSRVRIVSRPELNALASRRPLQGKPVTSAQAAG